MWTAQGMRERAEQGLPPKYLCSKKGGLLRPSPALAKVFQCRHCGAELVRAETAWVCPQSLSHGGLIGDQELERRLQQRFRQLKQWRRSPARTVRMRRRISQWEQRLGGTS